MPRGVKWNGSNARESSSTVCQQGAEWQTRGTGGRTGQHLVNSKDWPEGTKPTASKLLELINKQSKRCSLTGVSLTPQTANVDHVVPVVRGGSHDMNNLVVLHVDVNRAKGTMMLEDFLSMCAAIALHIANERNIAIDELASRWKAGS